MSQVRFHRRDAETRRRTQRKAETEMALGVGCSVLPRLRFGRRGSRDTRVLPPSGLARGLWLPATEHEAWQGATSATTATFRAHGLANPNREPTALRIVAGRQHASVSASSAAEPGAWLRATSYVAAQKSKPPQSSYGQNPSKTLSSSLRFPARLSVSAVNKEPH